MKNNLSILPRREFFKKTAQKTMPILGAIVLGPSAIIGTMVSCSKDICDGCEVSCMNNCTSSCTSECSGSSGIICRECGESCSNSCHESCESSAEQSMNIPHDAVDLGLSVLWATTNVGAIKPEDVGIYYGFADTKGMTPFDIWGKISMLEDYNSLEAICRTNYDAAWTKWGKPWRMPTSQEVRNLLHYCVFEEVAWEGIKGVQFTSKLNGNSIFFPYTGYYILDPHDSEQSLKFKMGDTFGFYWAGYPFSYLTISNQPGSSDSWGEVEICYQGDPKFLADNNIYEPDFWCIPIRPVMERDPNGCNASCTANCANDCSTNCTNACTARCFETCENSCDKTCANSCYVNCDSTCQSACKDSCNDLCMDSCDNTCSGSSKSTTCSSCNSTCIGGCSTACTGTCKESSTNSSCSSCANSCSSGCSSTCSGSCKGTAKSSCSGCATTCTTGCGRTCNTTCGGTCSIGCSGYCRSTQKSSCSGCFGSCSYLCDTTCRTYCYSSCKSIGYA